MSVLIPRRTHHVYRAFDEFGLLLYVGCSGNVVARLARHKHAPSIWYEYHARIEVAGPWVKDVALDVEAEAIESEGPFFNAQRDHTRGVQANRNEARRRLALVGIPRDVYFDDYAPDEEVNAAADEYVSRVWQMRLAIREAFPFVDDETRRSWYLAERSDAADEVASCVTRTAPSTTATSDTPLGAAVKCAAQQRPSTSVTSGPPLASTQRRAQGVAATSCPRSSTASTATKSGCVGARSASTPIG